MRGMASAPDFIQAPSPGRYPSKIAAAEAGFSKEKVDGAGNKSGGESHIKITTEIVDGPAKGAQAFDYIGTDGTTRYGIGGKRKLRQLGIDISSDNETPDAVIAQQLLNMHMMIEYGNEPMNVPVDGQPGQFKVREEIDARTGMKVTVQRLTVIGYIRGQAPVQQQAPVQHQQQVPVQQYAQPQHQQPQYAQQPQAPQGVPAGYPTGPFPGAPVGAPPPGLPAAWGGAPAGVPGGAPPGWGAPPPNGAVAPGLVQAPPSWTTGPGAPPPGGPQPR